MRRIRFVDVEAQTRALRADLERAAQRVLESGRFVLGPELEAFEAEFAAAVGGRYCVGVGSGTDALELALRAMGVGPGDEVITTANTFTATVMAISRAGARAVLVDHDPHTYLMDPRAAEAAVTGATKALLPVHLYGQPVDTAAVEAVAARHGLAVLYDACQAHGASDAGRPLGGLGTAVAYSFYPGKNLGALGDGGAVVTGDAALAERVRMLRDFGQREKYRHELAGANSRLDELQAAFLRVKLPHLEAWNEARRRVASLYHKHLDGAPVVLPAERPGARHAWHLYVVRVRDRDRVRAALEQGGIETGIHYPVPVHLQPAHASLGYGPGAFPVAEAQAPELLSLPMHPHLTDEDVERVCEALLGAVR